MTTPWIPSGMPWWVTHSIDSGASRRSSDSRLTVWMPGSTSVPLPVTMRKPMLSPAPSGDECSRRPERTRASLGSATRHMSLKIANRTTRPTTTAPARIRGSIALPFDAALHRADHDGPWREVLDDDHAGAGRDGVLGVGGVGVEGLAAATDGDHDLADPLGADGARDPADLPDHLLVGQPDPRFPVSRRAASRHRYLAASWPSGVKVRDPAAGSGGGPATTRSRPPSLAAYRPVSARRTRHSQPSSAPVATPTLVVTVRGPSASGTGAAAMASRVRSPMAAASAWPVPGSRTRNSSPPSGRGRRRPRDLAEAGRHHPQDLVAGGVAAGVVDLPEPVDVAQQDRERVAGRGQPLELLLEVAPVAQAGEGVGAAGQLQLGVAQPQLVLEGLVANGGVDPGQQLARLERLAQVVVGTETEPVDHVLGGHP